MRGIPGSGKSTIAARLAEATGAIIVSSDTIRKRLYGSEEIQGEGHVVFFWLRSDVANALEQGLDVIIDSTAISMTSVRQYSAIAEYFGATVQVIEVLPSLETCKKRNAGRSRKVPEHVIEGMHHAIQQHQKAEHAYEFDFTHAGKYVKMFA
jgi:predicted kinase